MTIFSRVKRLLRSQFASHDRYERYRQRTSPRSEEDFQDGFQDTFQSASHDDVKDPTIAAYYRLMELPYGTELEQVRSQYKTLMKRYHPDKFHDNPGKQSKATEYVKKLNQAYSAICLHLESIA